MTVSLEDVGLEEAKESGDEKDTAAAPHISAQSVTGGAGGQVKYQLSREANRKSQEHYYHLSFSHVDIQMYRNPYIQSIHSLLTSQEFKV